MKTEKLNYETPKVKVVCVQVEKGFAATAGTSTGSNESLNFGGSIDLG